MLRSAFFLPTLFCFSTTLFCQNTIIKDKKEFFNGDENHIIAYLNNNYHDLNPIEGIWTFSRIEYDESGNIVSQTPNEFKSAIVRDKGNYKRAFIEINLTNGFCKPYMVTFSIQKTAGNDLLYLCEPQGCNYPKTQYQYDTETHFIYRDGIPWLNAKVVLVGVKIFPTEEPEETILVSTGATATSEITQRKARVIDNPEGWELYVDWGKQLFSSYLLSTTVLDPANARNRDNHVGDPNSTVGILIDNPRNNSKVRIKLEPTPFSKGCDETFELAKKGKQYAVFPHIGWNYDKLRGMVQATPVNFRATVFINDKEAGTQNITATLRALDDCPLRAHDYNGDPVDLKFVSAAFVNEGHPRIKQYTTEIVQKKLVSEFVGAQMGEDAIHQQVFAFWKLFRDKGIVYSSIVNNGLNQVADNEAYSQRIRLFEDVVNESQANCIDGSAMLASCLAAVGIEPILVYVPGHAFLGYVVPGNPRLGTNTRIFYLETTMLGTKPALAPAAHCSSQNELAQVRTALTRANVAPAAEVEHFVAALCQGATAYDRHYAQNPQLMYEIPIFEARKFVKPISRSGFAVAASGSATPSVPTYAPPQPAAPAQPKNPGPTTVPVAPEPAAPDEKPDYPLNNRNEVYSSKPVVPSGAPATPNNQTGKNNTSIPAAQSSVAPTPSIQRAMHRSAVQSETDKVEYFTTAPERTGSCYKVQLRLEATGDVNKQPYQDLSALGRIDVEEIVATKRFRILLGDYDTYEQALPVAKQAQAAGLTNVAIVQYVNGDRTDFKQRDWSKL
ncbi:MAG: hypothetical protein SFV52_01730 [Saprospiraceae bacterium]|nr:hypothetical protein [Saprospiraceae bacterium]